MFLPDNIDFTQSKKYILSIRLTPSGFYFSIHCPTDSTIFYQNSVVFSLNDTYLKQIEKLIFDYSFFSHNFMRINVIQVNDKLTLVPNEYYDKSFESIILSTNFHKTSLDSKILSNGVDKLNCKIIWEMDESHHNFLSRSLLNPTFISHLSLIVSLFHKLHDNVSTALFINFNDDNMIDIVALSGEKLLLAKTFITQNSLEDSYFIQKTWEILQMDSQVDKLLFSGKTASHSECIETLKKVIPKTENLSISLPEDMKIDQNEVPTEIIYQLCV